MLQDIMVVDAGVSNQALEHDIYCIFERQTSEVLLVKVCVITICIIG